jgi:hypothetical protein
MLSVGFKVTSVGSGASKILTLWKSPALVDETGGEGSEQTGGAVRGSGKGPHSDMRKTSTSRGKASPGSVKKVYHAKFKQTRFVSFRYPLYFSDL